MKINDIDKMRKVRLQTIIGVLTFLAIFSIGLLIIHIYGYEVEPLNVLITSLFTFSATVIAANWITPAGGFKGK